MEKNSNQKTDSAPEVLNNDPINEVTNASIPPLPENPSNSKQLGIEKFEVVLKNLNKILDKLNKLEVKSSIPKVWLNELEVAALLNISRRQVYNMRVNGKLGASCVNGKQMYRLQDVNNVLEINYNKPFKTK